MRLREKPSPKLQKSVIENQTAEIV